MASFVIALKSLISSLIYLSIVKTPNFKTDEPNKKFLRVLYCAPTFATNFSKNTVMSMFLIGSLNYNPKNDLTTVFPAILEQNYIELISKCLLC